MLFTRNLGNIVMDLNDVERIDLNALGGADTITVNDLSGTDVTEVNVNLAAAGGGGDAQADTVIVNGTNGDDTTLLLGTGSAATIVGLAAQVNITGAEGANDRLAINALGGRTRSMPRACPRASLSSPSTAAPATTSSSAARMPTF